MDNQLCAKPFEGRGQGKDFILRRDDSKYFAYIHDLTIVGDASVTVEKANTGWKTFTGISGKVKDAHWTDNGEKLKFEQDGSTLRIWATGFEYGSSLVVRVAEIDFE